MHGVFLTAVSPTLCPLTEANTDLDNHIGDLHSTIVDKELEIIQELLNQVLECDDTIASAGDVSAELDCLLSFAEASRLYNFRRPSMIEDNYIEILQGRCVVWSPPHVPSPNFSRHPLYETVVDTFVPNDTHLIGGAGFNSDVAQTDNKQQWNSVLLCTGANACGKVSFHHLAALRFSLVALECLYETGTLENHCNICHRTWTWYRLPSSRFWHRYESIDPLNRINIIHSHRLAGKHTSRSHKGLIAYLAVLSPRSPLPWDWLIRV